MASLLAFCFYGAKFPLLVSATRPQGGDFYSNLTTISGQGYAVLTDNTLSVGFGDLSYLGVNAPQVLVGVFFRLQNPSMAVCVGNYPQGLVADVQGYRFANLMHAVTLSFGEDECQRLINLTLDALIMCSHAFVLNTSTSNQHLIEAAYYSLYNLHALALSISTIVESKADVVIFHSQLYGLVSLLVGELAQQKELITLLHERQEVGGKV